MKQVFIIIIGIFFVTIAQAVTLDFVNDRVGVGTVSPDSSLQISIPATAEDGFKLQSYTSVSSVTFSGLGLDDMTTNDSFSGNSTINYRVQIDGTGTPDTFKWSDDGGSTWDATTESITGSAQQLNNNVYITFAATTGHTLNDYWDFQGSAYTGTLFQIQDGGEFPRVLIDSQGRIGIGSNVTSVSYPLEIQTATGYAYSLWVDGEDIALDIDNKYYYAGEAQDSRIGFEATKLVIDANLVTSTDDIEFSSDKFEHVDGTFDLNDDNITTTGWGRFDGGLAINNIVYATTGLYINKTTSSGNAIGVYNNFTSTAAGANLYGAFNYLKTDNSATSAYANYYEVNCASSAGNHYANYANADYNTPTLTTFYAYYAKGGLLSVTDQKWGLYIEDLNNWLGEDNIKTYLGTGVTQDAYFTFDSANFDIYSPAAIDFVTAANTDLVLNWFGTTNSGVITWMEDEDYFSFADWVSSSATIDGDSFWLKDSKKFYLGTGEDMEMYSDGTDWYFYQTTASGAFAFMFYDNAGASTFELIDSDGAGVFTIDSDGGVIGLGAVNFGSAPSTELTNSAAPTTDTTGEIALDTTITDHQPLWQYYDGGENMTIIAIDTAQLPALDNEIIKYDAASDKFVLEADAGGASEINERFEPYSAKLPTSNYALIDAGDNNWRLLFDDTTDESATWDIILDDDYGAGTLYADIYFTMTSDTDSSNAVVWDVFVMAVTPGDAADVDADSYDSTNSGTETIPTQVDPTTAGKLDKETITLSNDDSLAAGDYLRIKLNRDANNGSDTASGDAEVIYMIIRE